MSLPMFLVPRLPTGAVLVLDGPEGHHAATVARLVCGESVLLGDGAGQVATAVVVATSKGRIELSIAERRVVPPPRPPRLVVAQALAKAERAELAVQAMTEAGVDEIVPWAARRSVVTWSGERGDRAAQRWVAVVREAAKQSRRAYLPAVAGLADTVDLMARGRAGARLLVLHESAAERLSSIDLGSIDLDDRDLAAAQPPPGELLLVVGPEGGIAPEELDQLAAAGGVAVRLGEQVLRTSTAGVAALAVLNVRLSRW